LVVEAIVRLDEACSWEWTVLSIGLIIEEATLFVWTERTARAEGREGGGRGRMEAAAQEVRWALLRVIWGEGRINGMRMDEGETGSCRG
jgi:hypothetical protein